MSIYMIRDGFFGDNFEMKLFMALIALLVCLYDYKKNKRYDYFWVFLFGSIVWTSVEIVLQMKETRIIEQASLLGKELPLFFSAILQGASEGAAIAILGVYFGDNLMNKATRLKTAVIFTVLIGVLLFYGFWNSSSVKNVGGDVISRRDMFTMESIIFIGIMSLIAIVWFWRGSEIERRRGLFMYLSMAIFAVFWTIGEVVNNTRWIEVGSNGILQRAPFLIEMFALSYDIFVEIALIYVPFLAIPYMLKLINVSRGCKVAL